MAWKSFSRQRFGPFRKKNDVAIRFSVKELRLLEKPRIVLFQVDDEKRRGLVKCLQTELRQTGLNFLLKASKETRPSHPYVHVQLQLPKNGDAAKKKVYGEKIAFYLASGILDYFQEGMKIQPLSYLPPNIMKVFFGNARSEQQQGDTIAMAGDGEEQEPVLELHEAVESGEKQHAEHIAQQLEEQTEQEEEQGEAVVTAPVEGAASVVEEAASVVEEAASVVEEAATGVAAAPPVPVSRESLLLAEVFFDYTLIHSDSEEKPFLLIGTLQVKNTGTEDLFNPIVCLRVSPVDSIKMGGQILPPKLVDTMAVQGASGMKGWRYLDDDWFTQAMERGEYWMVPIQPIQIAPGDTESFQNFQISFMKLETGQTVIVEGIVLCNDQQVHFSANNRIAISF